MEDYFDLAKVNSQMVIYKSQPFSLKWYDGYKDVKEITKFIESDEDNFLVGIGEQGETHSEWGEWYEYTGVHHEIYILQ